LLQADEATEFPDSLNGSGDCTQSMDGSGVSRDEDAVRACRFGIWCMRRKAAARPEVAAASKVPVCGFGE
jgi:hypothetical protein